MENNNFDFEVPGCFRGKVLEIGASEVDYVEMDGGHECIQKDTLSTHEYHILQGSGRWYHNGTIEEVMPGDKLVAEIGSEYALVGEMTLIEKITPPFDIDKVKTIRKANF